MPAPLANQIAAGEVVERPASVVKELIENALDAGARRIEVEVAGGGTHRILVADDGEGMTGEDALLAFHRHATSKVRRAEDLHELSTLGFRGEALPSIASVSRTTLITRPRAFGGEVSAPSIGTRVIVEGGKEVDVQEAAAPSGTAVEVRDLFYNTPARRKFLKSERTEVTRIAETVTNAALTFPGVAFRLRSEKRILIDWPPADRAGRVRAILQSRETDGLFPLPETRGPGASVRVEGFASTPSVTRAGRSCQHVIINDRYVRDRTVVNASYDVYRGLIPAGRHPLLFLYLTLDPADVDVNVHPAKAEVRFRDAGRVFPAVRRALGEGLVRASGVTGVTGPAPPADDAADPPSSSESATGAKVYSLRRPADRTEPGTSARPGRWGFTAPAGRAAGSGRVPGWARGPAAVFVEPVSERAREVLPPNAPLPLLDTAAPKRLLSEVRVLGQFHGTFILLEHPSGLLVMDQHTAHERVLFARLKEKADVGRVERQALLLPADVKVSPAEEALVADRLGDLERLGLVVEPFGPGALIVREVPALLDHVSPADLVREVIEGMDEGGGRRKDFSDLAEGLIDRMACRGAVKARDPLEKEEIEHLVRECLELDLLFTCPHGRPITLVLPKEEVERRFLRR